MNCTDNTPCLFVALAHCESLLACRLCSSFFQQRSWYCLLVRVSSIHNFCSCRDEYLNNNSGFLDKKVKAIKAGGYLGIIAALIAYYCGLAEMLDPTDIITLPSGKRNA